MQPSDSDPRNLLQVIGDWLQQRSRQRSAQPIDLSRRNHLSWLPTPGNVLFTLLVVVSLLWAQNVGAFPLAAPSASSVGTIAYQGRLADTGGAPLTGTYNMIFRLYSVASSGTPLWDEQWTGANSVQVSDGLFNVMLGSLTPIPQAVLSSNTSLFLGITVGTDSEMSPRVQLGSVPYAIQALTVPDGSISATKIQDTSIGSSKLVAETYPNISVVQGKLVSNVLLSSGDVEKSATNDSYVDLLSKSVTVSEPAVLRISYRALAWKTVGSGRIALGLRIDGTANTAPPQSEILNSWLTVGATTSSYWATNSEYLSNTAFVNVSPGTHTVSLVVSSWDGGNVSARAYAMSIEPLKQ